MNSKKSTYINIGGIVILIVIIFLTIGYSSFSNSATISSIVAMVAPDPKIRLTSVITTSNGATVTSTDYSSKSISVVFLCLIILLLHIMELQLI